MNNTQLDLTADLIDVRDVIARFEELESMGDEETLRLTDSDALGEFRVLRDLLDELKGYGGDEQWRGDWYPVTLIRDSHFTNYVSEMLVDCGEIPENLPHYIEVDWDATARNVRVDYTPVEIAGRTYWYR